MDSMGSTLTDKPFANWTFTSSQNTNKANTKHQIGWGLGGLTYNPSKFRSLEHQPLSAPKFAGIVS